MTPTAPQVCQLSHSGFLMLGEPVFRLSAGAGVPSMVVQLDNQEAVLPLRSVAREFHVDDESPDGQMLKLIEQALNYVAFLRLGDKLPSELSGGQASWEPTEQDRRTAASRVWQNFVRCIFARIGNSATVKGGEAPGWEEEAPNRLLVKQAITGAATLVEGADEAEITARVNTLNTEMAYIECMRRTLIRGIMGLQAKLMRIDLTRVPTSRQDTVKQVQTLGRRGLTEITHRFDAVDLRLDDVLALVRDPPQAVAWLRSQRDWLFRTNHAWSAVFADWASASPHFDEFLWKVVERTYSFLAPRFMSVQEWAVRDAPPKQQAVRAQIW
jgi:hypothetical protein